MEENKAVVEETTKKEQPIKDDKVEKIKVKRKPKKLAQKSEDIKIDLTKKEEKKEDADKKQETTDVATDQQTEALQEVVEEVPSGKETVQDEQPAVEEITEEEKPVEETKEEVVEEVVEETKEEVKLPDSIQKLMKFMEDTGGNLEDYVNLNRDVAGLDDQDVLLEYYRKTKPHLSLEEINFMMEDQFSYDEENMEEREIKRKKLALKEQVANARQHLDGLKSKYYEQVKARDKRLTPEQQKAVDFFNRYNKEQEQTSKTQKVFLNQTNQVFNKEFKGFEYNVGNKRFRLNIKDVAQVKELQSDANNLFKKFLNENNVMQDARGYHKSIYTAMNPDVIAQHFYEQGKVDGIKDQLTKAKNISVDPRQQQGETGGVKVRVLGDDSNSLKLKIRKTN